MRVIISAFIVILVLSAFFANGQTRRRATPTPSPTPSPTPTPLATLSIDAGLIYNNGDVKPVARTTFLLLNEDLNVILKTIPTRFPYHVSELGSQLSALRSAIQSTSGSLHEENTAEYNQIVRGIQSHTLATAVTDFGGKAKFSGIRPGVMFLYGDYNAGRNYAVWHMKVELKAGADTALTLDNNNALAVY